MMSMLGTPRLHVSKVLNHADDSTTAIYDRHDYFSEKRAALGLWANHLESVLAGDAEKVIPFRRAAS